nr:MAG TPA: hypothetical protein [Caudoviricetes sp.]
MINSLIECRQGLSLDSLAGIYEQNCTFYRSQ